MAQTDDVSTQASAGFPSPETEKRVDQLIAALLRAGVILAAALVLVGGVFYLKGESGPLPNYRVFHSEPAELRRVPRIFHAALSLNPAGLIQLGLLVLIATPIARVAFSVIVFLYERDWIYVMVTLIVLGLLCYSLFGGHG
jgi:uncharacterized membrane protein